MSTLKSTITRDVEVLSPEGVVESLAESDMEIEVEYNYISGSRGHCDKYGAPEEPDDDPEIEIESVVDVFGNEVKLTPEEQKRIEKEIWEDLSQP